MNLELTERQLKGWSAAYADVVSRGEVDPAAVPNIDSYIGARLGDIGEALAAQYDVDVAINAPSDERIEAVVEAVRTGKIPVAEFQKLEALAAAEE
jgi:hypothetical protein